jgi:carboxymethylenebutenolidase
VTNGGEWLPIANVPSYVAEPHDAKPWPALLVIHAVMGIDTYIKGLAESWAALGYYVVVPDLYANDPGFKQHAQEHIEMAAHMGTDPARQREVLSHYPPEIRVAVMQARDWISGRPAHTYIDKIRAAFDQLRSRPDIRAVGSIGFCMGGRLVGELAAQGAELAAGVIHYGGPPRFSQAINIRCPLEGHYASTDTGITSKIPAFADAMKSASKPFDYYVYEADHGFTLGGGRFPDAKRQAMTRSIDFLNKHLLW